MTRALISTALFALLTASLHAANHPLTPRLSGKWWTIASDPDLGPLTAKNQQPVDFGVWQAADGTWQLWSCIRGTKEPGKTRLFHRWESAKLTDTHWTPKGIALQADPALDETQGGLQAPYVIRHDGRFWMFYGDWANICLATSLDGKTFTRYRNPTGKPQLHFAGQIDRDRNGRDPMVLRTGNKWHCYYTAHPGNKGFDYARTSDDLIHWSEERVVAARGRSGDGPYSAECPFVVEPQPGAFYLFRTQAYGKNAQTMVYFSRNPLDFGIDNDAEHYVTTLPVAAPEIFRHQGEWFMAALLPTLKGIQITRLEWAAAPVATETPAPAVKPNLLTEAEKQQGWKLLFDGKNMEGWRGYQMDKMPPGWSVIDGALVRVKGGGGGKGAGGGDDIVTLETFANFELRLEYKLVKNGNSGVLYHVSEEPITAWHYAPEVQLLDNTAHPTRDKRQLAGACYDLYAPSKDVTRPVGQWNHLRVVVNGAHAEHWLNEEKVVEYELWSDDWNARVAKSKFKDKPKFGTFRTGPICLQDHSDRVEFRNIKIRAINSTRE